MPNIVTSPRTILLRRLAEMGMSEDEFVAEIKNRILHEDDHKEFLGLQYGIDTTYVHSIEAPHYEAITGIPAKLWIEQTIRYDKYCLALLDEALEKDPLFMDKTLNPEKYGL